VTVITYFRWTLVETSLSFYFDNDTARTRVVLRKDDDIPLEVRGRICYLVDKR
jgi:hypothetical protein